MVRLMLINDYKLIGSLIKASLSQESEITVVRACTPDEDLIKAVHETLADIILISGELSAATSVTLVQEIDDLDLPHNIIILGLDDNGHSIMPYLEAGAIGYVLKGATVDDLIESIFAAHQQQAQISPQIARTLIERVYTLAGQIKPGNTPSFEKVNLTRREVQVLKLLDEDLSNSEIAERLFIEVGTVKNHVHSILNKLEVNTRRDAVLHLALLRKNEMS